MRLLKELDVKIGIGLIEKKRLGLGKPNVIYVKNFMIQELTRAAQKKSSWGYLRKTKESICPEKQLLECFPFPELQYGKR